METQHASYHRMGEPGGPGCPLAVLPIEVLDHQGGQVAAQLLCADEKASELEMLRTVASRLGVRWGHDDFGWWAAVKERQFPTWAVWRQDDHGNLHLMQANLIEKEARDLVADYEARGHKQTYFAGQQSFEEG